MRLLLLALLALAIGCARPALAPLPPSADSKLDPALVALYEAHRDEEPERAPSGIQMVDDAVVIEATATQDGAQLQADLEALGLTNPSVAGVVVNGRLPLAALPDVAQLASLRYARPVYRPDRTPPPEPERYE